MPFSGIQQDRAAGRQQGHLEEALTQLRAVVGAEHVQTGEDAIARYSRDTIPFERVCAAVVFPGSTKEVCEVIKVAAAFKLPLWPFSKGNNWGYGATVAYQHGAIILILERLNRIEVNAELAYAVIEPGVTQQQLNDYLKDNGIKLWADCTDSTPHGSILGNALERGLGYTSYGDHFGHLCGLEVVLPDGQVVRTGAGPTNSETWNTFKWGTGPYLEGLFSQSNLGIVTKAGIWLMPEPEDFNVYSCDVYRDQDLPHVIDALRRLALNGAVQSNVHMVNDFLFLTLLMQYPYELRQAGTYLPDEVREELRRRFHIAPWTLTGGLYGSRGQIRANRALIRCELSRFGRLTFLNDRKMARLQRLTGVLKKVRNVPVVRSLANLFKNCFISRSPLEVLEVIPHVYPIFKGIPGEFIVSCAYFKSRRARPKTDINPGRDGCGLIWFAPVVPLTGKHTSAVLQLCKPVFRKYGIDFSMSFILVNPRSVVTLMEIFYDKDDPEETARARELYDELSDLTVKAGYPQYRTSVAYMDRILGSAPAYRQLADTLKGAVDPENILAPGRYGIGLSR
jgi:4-cresol dehydrogenase (hydroxylating)